MAEVDHIILDQTAFYPQSGGQLSDTGLLQKEDVVFKVVCAKQSELVHIIDKIGLEAGDRERGKLDWDRRYRVHAQPYRLPHPERRDFQRDRGKNYRQPN